MEGEGGGKKDGKYVEKGREEVMGSVREKKKEEERKEVKKKI